MSGTLQSVRDAFTHLRSGDVRAALDKIVGAERAARLRERAEHMIRRTWMKYALRGIGPNDNYERLDLCYKVPDPWHMETEIEQFRFADTNRVIEQHIGKRFGSILEVGCGEGHQSEYLARLTDRLVGIDVSATAVERARKRLPGAEFVAGDVYAQPWAKERAKFYLVTACEVCYYMNDVPRFLATIDQLGKRCLVTYFMHAAIRVESHAMKMPGAQKMTYKFDDDNIWYAVWWKGDSER